MLNYGNLLKIPIRLFDYYRNRTCKVYPNILAYRGCKV